MRYVPPDEDADEIEQRRIFRPERIPVSEETKYIRWGTQIEKDDTINEAFIDRHPNLVRSINKYMPLANYGKHDRIQKQIERLRRMEVSMMEDCGLLNDAEEITIDTLGDAQFSRGVDGFYTKELNTQRQKVKDETEKPERNKLSFFKTKKEKEPEGSEVRW